jgi:hypothetical protein
MVEQVPSPVMVELIKQLPQILSALGTVVVAIGTIIGVILAYKNGRKADVISAKADVAAVAATGAHAQTAAIQVTNSQIVEQTNGHLTALRDENRGLREMATNLLAILAARERNPVPIRKEDLPTEGAGPHPVPTPPLSRPPSPGSGSIPVGRRTTDDRIPQV